MTTADTQSTPVDTSTPASGNELQVPKYRLDEVLAKVRRLEEENSIKDRLYNEDRARMQAAMPRAIEPELTAEELGVDPQTFKAMTILAQKISGKAVREKAEIFSSQIGMLAGRTEKAELLASKGSDKVKYLPEIERRQQDHFNRTGTFLPAEIALDLIQSQEKDEKIRVLEARIAGQSATPAPTPEPYVAPMTSGPSAAGTRQMPTGGGSAAPGNKAFSELSLEEMEARLTQGFGAGATL